MLDKWRDNSLFQETNCSESRKFLIFLEKVYTFESLRLVLRYLTSRPLVRESALVTLTDD